MALDDRPDRYPFRDIEASWQRVWEDSKQFKVTEDPSRPKFYCLEMFPYPSGRIHMGHVRVYAIGDLLARFKWMRGFNVLHPMGWDAFGLPAENAAIENGVHPAVWTYENIKNMRTQLRRMGISYDWDRELATCDPSYYRWEQLIFIRMFERGLAYRKRTGVNWCPSCQTILANEQVESGRCWRCDTEVQLKEIDGWFFKITDYAEELLEWCDRLPGWPERVMTMQRNWIGRSEGAEFDLPVVGRPDVRITIFTTRPDTAFGMTYAVLAPEHPLVDALVTDEERARVAAFKRDVAQESEIERLAADRPKRGLRLEARAVNPFNGHEIPLFIADYVLMGYGTGAIMAVPGEDQRDWDFAKEHRLPVIATVKRPPEWEDTQAYTGDGVKINSGFLDGLGVNEAKRKAIDWLVERGLGKAKVNYRLRDWGISRQRYWGAPIPILYCDTCGMVPEREENLPVVLPQDVQISGKGGSPLAGVQSFVIARCPVCGGNARRDTDTMDTFVESSWYFLRYCSPAYERGMFERSAAEYWMPVDQYIGGIEHAVLHLLYARFYTKVLRDLGMIAVDEPFTALLSQGMVVKDGAKMSKSKGNVVDPDDLIRRYGADTARLFSLFAAPPEKDLDWNDHGVEGASRFLNRLWRFVHGHLDELNSGGPVDPMSLSEAGRAFRRIIHVTIQRVTEDIEKDFHFNTAISAVMELVNALVEFERTSLDTVAVEERAGLLREAVDTTLLLLGPVCPHITEELWKTLGHGTSLFRHSWPLPDQDAMKRDEVQIVVQVDGKVRSRLMADLDVEEAKIREMALADGRVLPWLNGRQVAKVVVVPGRLVNIVTRG